jgi:hypothetical protein
VNGSPTGYCTLPAAFVGPVRAAWFKQRSRLMSMVGLPTGCFTATLIPVKNIP